ncbi:hypothetical protein [Aquimarina sp. SS2-1]|uniref:hypothetical protein n=1 Tax=Aquimarina besae TaxID=3342247 RepID=UPI003670266A
MKLTKYEIEVVNLMLSDKFGDEELNSILTSPITGYDYTGAGYFLELTNHILPKERMTISEPTLFGRADNFEVGFLIFIENSKLTLECHSWGNENPPETVREKLITIEIIELDNKDA